MRILVRLCIGLLLGLVWTKPVLGVTCGITTNQVWLYSGQRSIQFQADNPLPGEFYNWYLVPDAGNPQLISTASGFTYNIADSGRFWILLKRQGTGGPTDTCEAFASFIFNNINFPGVTLTPDRIEKITSGSMVLGKRAWLNPENIDPDSLLTLRLDIGDYFEPDLQQYLPYPGGVQIDSINRYFNKMYHYVCTRKFQAGIADDQLDIISIDSSIINPAAIQTYLFELTRSGSYVPRMQVSNNNGYSFQVGIPGGSIRVGMKIGIPISNSPRFVAGSDAVFQENIKYWSGANAFLVDNTPHWTLGTPGPYADAVHWMLPGQQDTPVVKSTFLNLNLKERGTLRLGIAAKDTAGFWDTLYFSVLVEEGVLVTGRLMYDKGQACVNDSADQPLSKATILFQPGEYMTSSRADGTFEIHLPVGLYRIEPHFSSNLKIADCYTSGPPQRYIFVDSNYNDIFFNKLNSRELVVNIGGKEGFHPRFAEKASYKVSCANKGDSTAALVLAVQIDTALKQLNFQIPPTQVINNKYFWNLTLLENETRELQFEGIAPIYHSVADVKPMKFMVSTSILEGEAVVSNNFDTLIQTPVGAIDPNDKQAFPAGDLSVSTKKIDYVIRFQNTGTSFAQNVVVIDTIDTDLRIAGIVIQSTSHPYRIEAVANVIRFIFENINLPDSFTNEPGSHGYIRYTAELQAAVKPGVTIRNTAYIYFDAQAPVVTNTTEHRIVQDTSGKDTIVNPPPSNPRNVLVLYPNPALQAIFADYNGMETGFLQLFDQAGRLIQEQQVAAPGTYSFRADNLAQGIYTVRMQNTGYYAKVSVIR